MILTRDDKLQAVIMVLRKRYQFDSIEVVGNRIWGIHNHDSEGSWKVDCGWLQNYSFWGGLLSTGQLKVYEEGRLVGVITTDVTLPELPAKEN